MLRITKSKSRRQGVVLQLEGRLVGPWVAELQAICVESKNSAGMVSLDLRDVDYADRAGIRLLGELAAGGAKLVGTPPFIVEQLPSNLPRPPQP